MSTELRPPEVVLREHELNRALEAARALQARLELLGDRALDVIVVVSLRHSLARDLAAGGTAENGDISEAEARHERLLHGEALSDLESAALTRQALLLEDDIHG